jgi:dTDP-4-dehydrorhamnose reductase
LARLLVTGASGLLGANLVLEAMGSHQVTAVTHSHPLKIPGVVAYRADLADGEAARALIAEAAPEWIVHCAAATDLDGCEFDPVMAHRLNRDMAGHVAAAASSQEAAFVLISTDAVFDGLEGNYAETADPNPLSVYGRSKLEGERAVLEAHPQAVVVRTNIYGWNAQAKQSLAEWFLHRCRNGIRSPGWTDVWSTPILVNDLASIILRLLASGHGGIYHVGGATCLSKHDFGRRVAAAFDLDPNLIESASIQRAGLAAPRARRLCLRGEKIEAVLGVRLPTVKEGLERFRRMQDDGWPRRLRGALAAEGTTPAPAGREERYR